MIRTWASADGGWVVSASPSGPPRAWDCRDVEASSVPLVLLAARNGELSDRTYLKRIRDMSLSGNGRWLATAAEDTTVRLWDLAGAYPASSRRTLTGHQGPLYTCDMSADGRWLVTAGEETEARAWDLGSQRSDTPPILLAGHTKTIRTVAVSPNGRWAATGSYDRSVRLWNLRDADPTAAPQVFRRHRGELQTSAVSPDSRWLVTACDAGTVFIWDLLTEQPAADPFPLVAHEEAVFSLAFSGDSHYLVTSSADATVNLWDLRGDRPSLAQTFEFQRGIYRVTISPSGRWLSVHEFWTDHVALCDPLDENPQGSRVILPAKHGAQSMAISPDNRWLAIGTSRNAAMFWDLHQVDIAGSRRVLSGHHGALWCVQFSPDSDWLYSADDQGKIILWPIDLDHLLQRARRAAGRELSPEERAQYGLPTGVDVAQAVSS